MHGKIWKDIKLVMRNKYPQADKSWRQAGRRLVEKSTDEQEKDTCDKYGK